jgi:ABC-type oligopeptide transport system substrate-binding subunit/transcriptional regulator with XRE-family HTH domain
VETTASFGYWVRRQRKALDLTQAALAAQVGCAPVTIRKIEQDERRPSRQMAERLADCLAIPAAERAAFVQCGLGQQPVDALPLPSQPVSAATPPQPPFLALADEPTRDDPYHAFVGREEEVAVLAGHLATALAGNGRVVFVTGEAGRGKTALLTHFGRLAQAAHPDLIVAGGYGNAYAGMGDPYLPFREVMALLAGEVESPWAAGLITREQAQRLWDFAPAARETILNQGADLVDTFLPRAAGRAQPGRATVLEQRAFFEQFAGVWQALAAQRPLVILLDDLQWADAASMNLLFHLGRRLARSRILILAAYRASEVALAGREPPAILAPLVQEFRRIFGDIQLDLEQFEPAANRRLVDALLDKMPNRLEEPFRVALFWRTKGHPLFTMELLREMQARGALVQDEAGNWVEGAALDWEWLPARVEAVIEQRIGRLAETLRDLLAVASVEGETFTAQVVARLQGLELRPLLHQLSQELQKRHGLVRDLGEIEVAGQRLARYQFGHGLFQQYLYHSLGQAERRLLHGEIAAALEAFYGDQKEHVAVQLAHHYTEAGQGDKAVPYLLQAGDRARALYAHQEAIEHYRRALPFLKASGDLEGAARTLMKLGLTYHIAFDYERSRQAYEEGFALWQQLGHAQPAGRQLMGATLRLAWQDPSTLDPCMAGTTLSAPIITQLFSGLVAQSQEMEVIPDVARHWEVLDDGHVYVFHLRNDVYWSDGVPVTAVDFEYTFKRALDPATEAPVAGLLLYGIKGARAFHQGELRDPAQVGISARDEYTLVIELESPISYFLYSLTYYVLLPAPRHAVMRYGRAWADPAHLVTNGPFRLAAWEPGRLMRLARNPRYHGRFTGNVQQVELTLGLDTEAQFAAYQANRLDVVFNWFFASPDIAPLHRRYPDEYQMRSRLGTVAVFFDLSRPPFDDARLRRAFSLAMDRAALAEQVLQGYEIAAIGGPLPPGMPGHQPGITFYDPVAARQWLAEAGFAGGAGFPPVTFLVYATRRQHGLFLQAQWRATLGVTVNLEIVSPGSFDEQRRLAAPAIFLAGWLADHGDPDNFLRVWLTLDLPPWHHAGYEELLEQARQTVDQAARMRLYQQAERLLMQEAALMPLCHATWNLLLKPWVKQFPTTIVKHPGFWHQVVIDTGRQPAVAARS